MVAGFRHTNEAVKSKTTAALSWTSWGEHLRGGSPYGDFLVNFLCKENWNTGASGTLSKGVTVTFYARFAGIWFILNPKKKPSQTAKFSRSYLAHFLALCLKGIVSLSRANARTRGIILWRIGYINPTIRNDAVSPI